MSPALSGDGLELASKYEQPAFDRYPRPPKSLYLHFPFCEHRCHYCDFSVTRSAEPPVRSWLDAIEFANAASRLAILEPCYLITGEGDAREVVWTEGQRGIEFFEDLKLIAYGRQND